MIKKKIVTIKVIDEFGKYVTIFGQFKPYDVQQLIDLTEKNKMSCLAFIDLSGDTYFNELQCKDIKKELKIFNNYNLNKALLDTLFRAADTAIKSESYIKIG